MCIYIYIYIYIYIVFTPLPPEPIPTERSGEALGVDEGQLQSLDSLVA